MVASLSQLHKSLLAEWSKEPKNTSTIEQILKQIGVSLMLIWPWHSVVSLVDVSSAVFEEALFDQAAIGSLDEKALTTIYKFVHFVTCVGFCKYGRGRVCPTFP